MVSMTVKFETEKDLQNITLFLRYLQVLDPKIPDAYRWSMTVNHKIFKMHIAYEDVLRQIPIWYADHQEMEKIGHGSMRESVILSLRYETFLNSVYSLCESIAKITAGFYPGLPKGFHKQRNFLLKGKLVVDPEYERILESLNWYPEVQAIRSEATHFLSGITTISKNGEPGYFNKPTSRRNEVPSEISLASVGKHIQEIFHGVDIFLIQFGDYFINKIDHEKRITNICLKTDGGYVGARAQSLNEIIQLKPGICVTYKSDCPYKLSCDAYRNAILETK